MTHSVKVANAITPTSSQLPSLHIKPKASSSAELVSDINSPPSYHFPLEILQNFVNARASQKWLSIFFFVMGMVVMAKPFLKFQFVL